jgi:alkanesulfonate monooxygenase SsuD/methylene tetrahydromethanopterin reductase-like flavin-dependent oxidoreductase (luciferase family)
MQFGIALPDFSQLAAREALVTTAREAEALGYGSIWTTDHVLMATDCSQGHRAVWNPGTSGVTRDLACNACRTAGGG